MLAVDGDGGIELDGPAPLSQHLRKLALNLFLILGNYYLDFKRCPALEDLRITRCSLFTSKIFSQSVEHLSMTSCFLGFTRIRICAPSLISLQLRHCYGKAPLLESMPPALQTAVFDIGPLDYCGDSEKCLGSCLNCRSHDVQNTDDILGGLSDTIKLELTFSSGTVCQTSILVLNHCLFMSFTVSYSKCIHL